MQPEAAALGALVEPEEREEAAVPLVGHRARDLGEALGGHHDDVLAHRGALGVDHRVGEALADAAQRDVEREQLAGEQVHGRTTFAACSISARTGAGRNTPSTSSAPASAHIGACEAPGSGSAKPSRGRPSTMRDQ